MAGWLDHQDHQRAVRPQETDLAANRRGRPVVHVIRRYAPLVGGTERYARDLARAQAARGDDVRIVTLDHDVTAVDAGRLARKDRDGSVAVVRLPGVGGRRWAVTLRPDLLLGEIRHGRVVHVHDIRFMVGLIAVAARIRQVPCLVHTHGLIFHTGAFLRLKTAVLRWYHAPLLRTTGAWIVCSSEADRVRLLGVAPSLASHAVTLENAVDLTALLTTPRTPVPGVIVVAGRVTPTKGIDRLLRALAGMRDLAWRLEIHGAADPGEIDRLTRIASDLGLADRMQLAGRYDDDALPAIYGRASVAAFPSHAEGFGISLLEAMAAGVPVVASDLPSHRAIVSPAASDALVDFDTDAATIALRRTLSMTAAAAASTERSLRERAMQFDLTSLVASLDRLAAGELAHASG
jgi:glycosyltransferase involved in cell wall biosynthesis